MQVPTDDQGRPRISISQIRTYGAANLAGQESENPRGCPRLYKAKYVDKSVVPEPRAKNLAIGTVIHDALHRMERDSVAPETALESSWQVHLDAEDWKAALALLNDYLARGGPMTRFGTLAHELDLNAVLYVDEDFGPVVFRGIVDWIGLDLDDQTVLHGVDYKTNIQPPSRAEVMRDAQLKGYDWLLRKNWERWMPKGSPPRTVMHLDALRYRDVDVRFTPDEIEQWEGWAVAVARQMLRDEDAEPHLNDGCTYCPIRHDCPKWVALPGAAKSLAMRRTGETPDELWSRREAFAQTRKLAETEIKSLDKKLEEELHANGGVLEFGGQRWVEENGWEQDVDWEQLMRVLGPKFFAAVSTSKAAVKRASAGLDESTKALAEACIRQVPAGTSIRKGVAE